MTAPTTARFGVPVTVTLTVRNLGPAAAGGATLTLLSSGPATVTAMSTLLGTCTPGAAAGCALGSIPAGGSVRVTVRVTPRYVGALAFAASLRSASDPTPGNDTAVRALLVGRR